MVLESRCWRGSRAESVHATLAPEAVSILWPGAAWLHSLPSSDPLLLHLFVLPSVWTKFLFTFLKMTHSGTFRPFMKIIPTKTHLKIVSKATFMDPLRNGYPCGRGGSLSSLPMWAFTSYGCGAIPPGQTWWLKTRETWSFTVLGR